MKSVAAVLLVFVAMPALAIWPFDDAADELQEASYERMCCLFQAGCEWDAWSTCAAEEKRQCRHLLTDADLRSAECRKEFDESRCFAAAEAGQIQAKIECK